MTLVELMKRDQQELINLQEFAALHEIDGAIISAIVRKETVRRSKKDKMTFEGLHGDFAVVNCRTEDLMRKRRSYPKEGSNIELDGKLYKVETSKDELGITRMRLAAYRQHKVKGEFDFE